MKKLVTVAMAIALVFSAGSAMAQPEPGDLGIFADAQGTINTATPAPFAPQFVYVVAFDIPSEFNAYEVGVTGLIENGASVLGATFLGANPLNFGDGTNYRVGAGSCESGGGVSTLVSINYILLAPPAADTALCVGGIPNGSVALAGNPGFSSCDAELFPFGVAQNGGGTYPDGCMILNATNPDDVVDNDDASFGELKARF